MGTETKSRAAAKLAAMVDRVGYPALAAHPVGLDLYYRKVCQHVLYRTLHPTDNVRQYVNVRSYVILKMM